VSLGRQAALVYDRYFGYDDAGRLIGEDWLDGDGGSLYAFAWEYDPAGNRTLQVRNGVATYYEYDALNELTHERTGDAHTYYEWNEDGALAVKRGAAGETIFAWDPTEAMESATLPDSSARN
jgi:YD repeat-containing protein